jgi:hypothetical protein
MYTCLLKSGTLLSLVFTVHCVNAQVTTDANNNVLVGSGTVENSEGWNKVCQVNGGVKARKVVVDQQTWADYVFDSTYRLLPLAEVEQFIAKNKHLPDVPSAEEVSKNGTDLGDTQALLLKKIEELTIYVIELKKQLQEQRQQLDRLKTAQ